MLTVVCYDVASPKRLRKVASEVENFGTRVQYSVYECHLDRSQREEMLDRLSRLIDWEKDRVDCYVLCADDLGLVLSDGPGAVTTDPGFHVV